ncbi:MAG TPA: hypothetical protein PL157_05190 [Acidobacteriota bacterium]|nr:hypothetical protein [Acidobacteriota bacterium]
MERVESRVKAIVERSGKQAPQARTPGNSKSFFSRNITPSLMKLFYIRALTVFARNNQTSSADEQGNLVVRVL